jgi:hypothetical protein
MSAQLPEVLGQPVGRVQPPEDEHLAHDSIVTLGHRDAECST